MKKMSKFAMAAMLVLGLASAAQAADIKASGKWQIDASWHNDMDMNQGTKENSFTIEQRVRTAFQFIANENLKGVLDTQIGTNSWGNGEYQIGAGRTPSQAATSTGSNTGGNGNIMLRKAYLDFKVPNTKVNILAGFQTVNLPSAFGGGSAILDDQVGALVVSAPIIDGVSVLAGYARPTDANTAGSTSDIQGMSGYGLFTGGLGIHYGAERLGCLTVPAGAGNSKRQLKLLSDFKVDGVHIIPSYALHFASFLKGEGVDPKRLNWRIALIGAEPHTEEVRQRVQDLLGLKAYNSYGMTEMNGPGVAFECEKQAGMHVWEDAYIAEIIDPETGEHVAEGEVGELVMTTLCRDGMPLLRYRTRDLTRFIPGPCACGRTHRRIDRIAGRADDMMIIKGCNIYPMQIEQALMSLPEVAQNYLIEIFKEGEMDQLRVKVEIKDDYFVEDMCTARRQAQANGVRLRLPRAPSAKGMNPLGTLVPPMPRGACPTRHRRKRGRERPCPPS